MFALSSQYALFMRKYKVTGHENLSGLLSLLGIFQPLQCLCQSNQQDISPNDEMILIGTNTDNEIKVILALGKYIYTPVWSPAGDWIAFMSGPKGDRDIYLVRSNGTGLINVTQSPIEEYAPAWRVILP